MERRCGAMEGMVSMKVVILAGGMGTRISEESSLKPKPMIEIGDKPILWHIMKWYASFGFLDFVICCGYKGHMIKEYFMNYYSYQGDGCFNLRDHTAQYAANKKEPWRVTLANTGARTMTAGRILQIREYVGNEPFMLTYGDGVSDVDIHKLLEYHELNRKLVTITTTQPEGRFGAISIGEGGMVHKFKEKARKDQSWVNAGFMVMEPGIFDYLGDGSEMLEDGPFERIAAANQMDAYKHEGFWSPMDTMHDKAYLEGLWKQGKAPWKVRDENV